MPKSGFMIFSKEKRAEVKEQNPDIKFGDIAKKLGQMWKELSEEERKVYSDRAAAENAENPEKKEKKPKKSSKSKKSKKDESEGEEDEKGGDDDSDE